MSDYLPMDKKVKRAWVKALRSGKFRQTRGRLKGPKGFCCLGVYCEISGAGKWEERRYVVGETSSALQIPYALQEKINLDPGAQDKLAAMNDNKRSFRYIADWIQANL